MKAKRYKSIDEFAKDLGVAPERVGISKMKSKLKKKPVLTSIDFCSIYWIFREIKSYLV
jgi:hypothetical protein